MPFVAGNDHGLLEFLSYGSPPKPTLNNDILAWNGQAFRALYNWAALETRVTPSHVFSAVHIYTRLPSSFQDKPENLFACLSLAIKLARNFHSDSGSRLSCQTLLDSSSSIVDRKTSVLLEEVFQAEKSVVEALDWDLMGPAPFVILESLMRESLSLFPHAYIELFDPMGWQLMQSIIAAEFCKETFHLTPLLASVFLGYVKHCCWSLNKHYRAVEKHVVKFLSLPHPVSLPLGDRYLLHDHEEKAFRIALKEHSEALPKPFPQISSDAIQIGSDPVNEHTLYLKDFLPFYFRCTPLKE